MTTTAHPPTPRRAEPPGGRPRRWVLPLLLVLVGIAVLLYPVAATQYNNVKQRAFAEQYNRDIQQAATSDLAGELEAARQYNTTLSGVPILDPWLERAGSDPGSDAFAAYKVQLGRFDAMARVRVPSADIDLPVYHGTSDPVLAKGAGHLYGTSLPVGGESTHAVLTSHTGLTTATLFDHLSGVVEGDLVFIDVYGETLAYRVDQIKIVLPDEIGDLVTIPGHDYLTLFTCTPYAVNTHRLLVRAERTDQTPEMAAAAAGGPAIRIEAWMWYLIGSAGAGLAAIATMVAREGSSRGWWKSGHPATPGTRRRGRGRTERAS
ncbi:MAG: class C sortase [Propionibacteriaceae bacterium]|nr:class C sortase [Propionibacteriaceae bacterium]